MKKLFEISNINKIQQTMYMLSEFCIPNSNHHNHHNTALNESETDFDLSRMPDNIYEEIDEDELSIKDEDEQFNNIY